MTNKENEWFFTILQEAYHKGITSREISVEGLYNEIKEKLSVVFSKQREV